MYSLICGSASNDRDFLMFCPLWPSEELCRLHGAVQTRCASRAEPQLMNPRIVGRQQRDPTLARTALDWLTQVDAGC